LHSIAFKLLTNLLFIGLDCIFETMKKAINPTVDLQIYYEIASGKLHPHKLNKTLHNINKLIFDENTLKIHSCKQQDEQQFIEDTDFTLFGYRSAEDYVLDIRKDYVKRTSDIFLKPINIYTLTDIIKHPKPKDFTSDCYLTLICDEYERIKIRALKFLDMQTEESKISVYAHKNILKAKRIWQDVENWLEQAKHSFVFTEDSAAIYSIYLLSIFLKKVIEFYQKEFAPFISSNDKTQGTFCVKVGDKTPLFIKYPYLYPDYKTDKLQVECSSEEYQKKSPRSNTNTSEEQTATNTKNSKEYNFGKKSPRLDSESEVDCSAKINGQLNVFMDIIYQLTEVIKIDEKPFLESTPDFWGLFLSKYFTDKNGHKLSKNTITTLLKRSRADKRIHANSPKRIDITKFLKELDE